jgi:hypothetical protein
VRCANSCFLLPTSLEADEDEVEADDEDDDEEEEEEAKDDDEEEPRLRRLRPRNSLSSMRGSLSSAASLAFQSAIFSEREEK